jgi:hypothetical protein
MFWAEYFGKDKSKCSLFWKVEIKNAVQAGKI